MTRILHTESSMNMGGQELRIIMEMEGLSELGFTSVLASRHDSKIAEEARRRGLRIYEVAMRGSADPLALMQFLWIIRKERIDIVSTHGSKDGWSAGLAARILGKRIARSRNVANPIRSHFLGRLVYTTLCDQIITTSESIKRGMVVRGIPSEKITCVPTGVDLTRFQSLVEKGKFRAELGIEGERSLVGMVSVLRGDKGPDIFLRAAEYVLSECPEVFFALVGDGWMRGKLERMVQNSRCSKNIRMTGFRRDIPHVLADLDLLVLSARIPEGIPQAILQAHAMRVPVVASDVGGINEVALDGETAVLVPPNDPVRLAEAILSVLKDPEEAQNRAERGHQMVLRDHTKEVMLKRMVSIYENLLGR